jgi:hypothetical protein
MGYLRGSPGSNREVQQPRKPRYIAATLSPSWSMFLRRNLLFPHRSDPFNALLQGLKPLDLQDKHLASSMAVVKSLVGVWGKYLDFAALGSYLMSKGCPLYPNNRVATVLVFLLPFPQNGLGRLSCMRLMLKFSISSSGALDTALG